MNKFFILFSNLEVIVIGKSVPETTKRSRIFNAYLTTGEKTTIGDEEVFIAYRLVGWKDNSDDACDQLKFGAVSF